MLEPFEPWIRKGEGRCPHCGFHTTKQVHADNCQGRHQQGTRLKPSPTLRPPRASAWDERENGSSWIDKL